MPSPVRMMDPASLALHPKAGRVDPTPPEQYERFLADVRVRGVQEPIKLQPGTTTVLDGRTRLRAATDAKLTAVPVEDAELQGDSPELFMYRAALLRRHLTRDQITALAVIVEEEVAKEAKSRQQAAGGDRKSEKAREASHSARGAKNDSPPPLHAAKEAAKQAGVSPRSVAYAKEVKKKSPETFEKLRAGKVTLAEAKRVVKAVTPKPKPVKSPLAHVKPSSFAASEKPSLLIAVGGGAVPLQPCPFCGSADVHVVLSGPRFVECKACNSRGPSSSTSDFAAAREAWNKRCAGKEKVAS